MPHSAQDMPDPPNHPLALRMAVIAFINQSITIACVYGTFSVLLGGVESRLGIGRALSTAAMPAANLATAICAPIVGVLATRYSPRLIMLTGSLLSVAGFALLGLTTSYPLYLVAYGLLLGPGMAVGVVMPGTLVLRWFVANRGKALGLMNTSIVHPILPLAATWILHSYGVPSTYAALALISMIPLIANLFIVDRVPGSAVASPAMPDGPANAGATSMVRIICSPRFWGVALAFIASATSSIVIITHMVPMARSWGLSATLGASLISIQALAGAAGTILFGWLADRLGGVLVLAILVFDSALLWSLLLYHPSFPFAAVIIGVIGLHAAGAVPVLSLALSQVFGGGSFSRAYGMVQLVTLPFSVLCVPVAALLYTRSGSYNGTIIGVAAFLGVGSLLALSAIRPGGNNARATQPV